MRKAFNLGAGFILGVSMLIGLAEAKTKSNPAVEAHIPFAFHLGNRTLPAGDYKFEVATGTPNSEDTMCVLIVRNRTAGIYQALAVPVRPGAGLEEESRVVFGEGDAHLLVAVWERGNRLELQPSLLTAAENADDWSATPQLVSLASRPVGQ